MTDMRDQNQTFDLLDRTLETFGADANRWPAGVKIKLSPFIDGNADARRRVAEAAALDKVLGFAPKISDARHAALTDQIVAKALRQPRAVSASGSVTPSAGQHKLQPRFKAWRENYLTAGALAASLMLGILAGQNATVVTLTEAMLTGSDATDVSAQQVAKSDELDTYYDEDLL